MIEVQLAGVTHHLDWEEWEHRVRSGRVPPDALVRIDAVTGQDHVRADSLESWQSLYDPRQIAWRQRYATDPVPWITALLVGVQIRLWWWGRLDWFSALEKRFLPKSLGALLEDGEVWRLWTMGVLHFDLLHLVSNLMFLAYTGWILERALGRLNLTVLYAGSVLGGTLLSLYGAPGSESIGASGGVFGLIAATVAFGYARPDMLPERGRRYFGFALLPYLLLFFFSGLQNPNTDNWGHLGGALAGAALALLVVPPGQPADVRRNHGIAGGLVLGTLCLSAVAGLFGPQLAPLGDAENVLAASLRVPTLRDRDDEAPHLRWRAPLGWGRGTTLAGDGATTSRSIAGDRAWTVVETEHTSPVTVPELWDRWRERAEVRGHTLEEAVLQRALVGGHEGFEAQTFATDPEGRRHAVRWRAAQRGLFTVHEVWQSDAASAPKLGPLADRLIASTVWSDPPVLVDAQAAFDAAPDRWGARRQLAEALGKIGQVQAAEDLWNGLLQERAEVRPAWLGRLQLAQWFPPDRQDHEDLLNQALAADVGHEVTVAVAEGLLAMPDDAGRSRALGLLMAAWTHDPGDRTLRRAMRSLSLPIGLAPTGLPAREAWSPAPDLPPQPALTWPLTLDGAAAWSVALSAREAAVRQAVADARGLDRAEPLLWLHGRHAPNTYAERAVDTLFDVLAKAEGEPENRPRWWDDTVLGLPQDLAADLQSDTPEVLVSYLKRDGA